MKKHLIPVIFLSVFVIQIQAQTSNLGIKVGLNYYSPFGDFISDVKARPSFELGVFGEIPIKGRFSFHPEVLYSSRRTSQFFLDYPINNAGANGEGDLRINQHNIVLPLITKYNFNDSFSLEVGPQIGFLVSTSARFNDVKNSFSDKVEFDVGPTLGVGYDVGDKLKFQLRYFLGISDLLRESGVEQITNQKDNQFNSVLSLSAGFVIF